MTVRFAFLCVLMMSGSLAHAADTQSYRVDIVSVGDSNMDTTLKATSDLLALRGKASVSPFGLIARARSDVDRLKTAVESFGYYQSAVVIKINGTMISNPGLGEILSALPKGTDANVNISFTLGPLYHLRNVEVEGDLPDSARSTLGLKAGQPAVAFLVLAGASRLLNALQEQGYAFAKVDPPVAYEAPDAPLLDLKIQVFTGPQVNFGAIRIEGLQRVRESLLRARLLLQTGAPYSPSVVERARRDLLGLGVFGQVSIQMGTAVDDTGGVPITFKVRERLRHAVTINSAFSSDLGGSGGVTWSDRNVFGNAEQLNVAASVINLGGSNTTGVGYDTSVKLLIPDFRRRDQSIQFAVGAIKQSLQAYDQTSRTSSVTLSRKLSSLWSASVGVATADEQIKQENVTNDYTRVALPLMVSYDSTKLSSPLEDPRNGIRGSVSVTPTLAIGHPNAIFIISQVRLATYFDLNKWVATDPGRTVLAARALAGLAQGAGELSLPPDQRFYGGGSGTIRGYGYQSVGPKFAADGNPIGGTAITAGSLELRQRFGANFGAAFFVDAGQVSASLKAVRDEFRIGVGAGLRYFTPIGPIRLDVALPTKRNVFITHPLPTATVPLPPTGQVTDSAFEIYIGLGQSF